MAVLDGNGLDRLWSHIETNINSALAKYFGTKSDINHTHSYNDLTDKPEVSTEITIDSVLSSASTNPVQNKVVNAAISDLQAKVGNSSVSTQINDALNEFSSGKTLTEHLAEENMVLSSRQYGDTLPEPGTPGRIFFLKASE